MPGIDTDPDPAKWCGSDAIRIHNTINYASVYIYRYPVLLTC
jgi:hypothetical protein